MTVTGSKLYMNTNSALSGQLTIYLHLQQQAVQTVQIACNRPRLPTQFLAQKPVEAAPTLVGLLFSLCGTAQTIASQRACAQALGQPIDAKKFAQQDWQVTLESLFEHVLRLSQAWSQAVHCPPLAATSLQQVFQLKRELLGQTANAQQAMQAWLEQILLGLPMQTWLFYLEQGDWETLSQHGHIGQLISAIVKNGWQRLGNQPVPALPAVSLQWWSERLQMADAEPFMATPTFAGQTCETSTLTRQSQHPALQTCIKQYGYGLLTRLLARVVDLLVRWDTAVNLSSVETTPVRDLLLANEGIACIETARGLLVHRVVQQDGLIQHYQIVAPTEWNFHPYGSLYPMLTGLPVHNEMTLRAQAQALITALDPCVTYQLEIIHDA